MSKVAEWLIATLVSVLFGYLMIYYAGLPVWVVAFTGVCIISLGLLSGKKRKP